MKSEKEDPPRDNTGDQDQGTGRRDFLLQAALAAVGMSAVVAAPKPASASQASGGGASLQKPISWRLLKSETKKNGAIKESAVVIELTGSNGARHVSDCYTKRIEYSGGHEDIVVMKTDQFAGASDSVPVHSDSRTILTSTRLGELRDGQRRDEVTVQIVDGSGRREFPPLLVKVPVPNPYSGMSDQELMDRILSEKLGAR